MPARCAWTWRSIAILQRSRSSAPINSIKRRKAQLFRGQRLVEILKQDQYQPLPVERQIVIIWAGSNKYLDDLEISQVRRFEREMYIYIETNNPGLFTKIREKKALDDSIRGELKSTLDGFKEAFGATVSAAAAAD